jgi:hypothetical protein
MVRKRNHGRNEGWKGARGSNMAELVDLLNEIRREAGVEDLGRDAAAPRVRLAQK